MNNCECKIVNGKIVKSCDLHLAAQKKHARAVAMLIEAKIERIFKDTFLFEIKDQLISEIRRFRQ